MTPREDPFDPQLRKCLAEIEASMKKYKCGGFVTLSSQTHTEFKLHLPEWSVAERATITDAAGKKVETIVVRHRRATNHLTEATMHLLLSTRDTCRSVAADMQKVYEYCKEHLQIEHVDQIRRRDS